MRHLSGDLAEEQFRPLRLMNGLYLQLHAYMLRIAIPYGALNSRQMAVLASIARDYDRDYGYDRGNDACVRQVEQWDPYSGRYVWVNLRQRC